MSSRSRNDRVLSDLTPFLVARPEHAARMNLEPLGIRIEQVFDPTRVESARFLHLLQVMDRMTFGPEGMPMPRWVFYDCAEIPGGIFGFARPAEALPAEVSRALGCPEDDRGLIPLSMYIGIPVKPPDVWFGHNLASLNPSFPQMGLKGLASITKSLALSVYRCRAQIGATQWSSAALRIHTRFGPLELETAWTPAHSDPATLTYRVELTEEKLRAAVGEPGMKLEQPGVELEIAASDPEAMKALQARIERGERFVIVGPPRRVRGDQLTPVARAPG